MLLLLLALLSIKTPKAQKLLPKQCARSCFLLVVVVAVAAAYTTTITYDRHGVDRADLRHIRRRIHPAVADIAAAAGDPLAVRRGFGASRQLVQRRLLVKRRHDALRRQHAAGEQRAQQRQKLLRVQHVEEGVIQHFFLIEIGIVAAAVFIAAAVVHVILPAQRDARIRRHHVLRRRSVERIAGDSRQCERRRSHGVAVVGAVTDGNLARVLVRRHDATVRIVHDDQQRRRAVGRRDDQSREIHAMQYGVAQSHHDAFHVRLCKRHSRW